MVLNGNLLKYKQVDLLDLRLVFQAFFMKTKQSGIYIIENLQNNKFYIGSAVNVKLRFGHHRRLLRKGKHHSSRLQADWNQCGESAFRFRMLEDVADKKKLKEHEQVWLNSYPSHNATIGYNIAKTSKKGVRRKVKPPVEVYEISTTVEKNQVKSRAKRIY